MTDFTNCPIVPGRAYNGANGSKIAVEYGGGIYMLKFPPSGERKPTNLSYTNSCISEHLASSIFNLIGINAQKTELGTFSIKGKTNVALPKNFKNILAVCRSRNISCDIILQNIAQLKSLFKDDWEGIIGNCDTLLYLGGNEYGTYEYLSKILGKETERTKSQSIGKGSRGSSSDSLQTAGRELCMPDEIRRMRDDECLLLMRSEDPVIDKKYNLLHHPNVKYTPDAGGEPYVMPPDYMGDAVTITMDAVAAATAPEITEEMYEQLDYLEKHPEENYYENEENFSQYDQGD